MTPKNYDLTFHYFRAFAIVSVMLTHMWVGPVLAGSEDAAKLQDSLRLCLFHSATIYFVFISGYLFDFVNRRKGQFSPLRFYKSKIVNVFCPYLILSLLLLPDKFSGVVYLLFGGIYPILKEFFERLHYVISWILKFSVFNTALLLLIAVSVYVMHVEDTGLGFNWVVFGLGNLTFLLYDIAMTKLISLYLVKLRRLFGFKDYFGTK